MYSIVTLILLIVGLFQVNEVMIVTSGLFAIASAINYLASKLIKRESQTNQE